MFRTYSVINIKENVILFCHHNVIHTNCSESGLMTEHYATSNFESKYSNNKMIFFWHRGGEAGSVTAATLESWDRFSARPKIFTELII